jgi:hypothetical protein
LSSVLGHYILVNHLIIDKHSLYEVKGSEKIELFIASPQGYYYPVFPPLIPKNSGLLNKIKPVISCETVLVMTSVNTFIFQQLKVQERYHTLKPEDTTYHIVIYINIKPYKQS